MNSDSFLRNTIIVLLCLATLIPFIVANSFFFPFITGKNFTFRIIVEIAFALWLLLMLKDVSARPRWKALPALMLAFLTSAGISVLLAVNPEKAFWSNFERMEGWIGLAHSTAYFFILWSVMQTEKAWGWFWNTSIVVSVLMSLYGFLQLSGALTINQGGLRVDGTFGNATYMAVYMLFHVFISAYYLVKTWAKSFLMRYFYMFAIALQVVMIFFSATRGTTLALIGGTLLTGILLLLLGKGNAEMKKWGAVSLVVIAVLVGGFFAIKDTQFVQNDGILTRLASIDISQGETRFAIWGMALEGFQERPIFGWGQEGYNYIFNKYFKPSLHSQEPWFDRAHNAFVDWLVAGGIVGFMLYVSLYVATMWAIWRPGSALTSFERSIFTGLLAAYAFHNLFVFDHLLSYVFFMSTLAYIYYRSYMNDAPVSGVPLSGGTTMIVAPAIILAMSAVFYFANVPGMAVASNIIQGLSPHQTINENLEYFKKARAGSGLGSQESAEQLIQFAVQVKSLNAGDAAFQQEAALYAASEMEKELQKTPNDARLHMFLGSFWRQMGNYEGAVASLTRAHELSPNKQQIMFELAVLEFNRGNVAGSLEWFKKAYDLEPSYASAVAYYASTAIRAGEIALAEKLMMEKWGTVTPDNEFILQAYLEVKNFPRVVAVAEARVAAQPKNAQFHVQLAAAYLTAGNRTAAVEAIKTAISLDPSFKEQGEFYIKEITEGRNP
ncbi:O-antigen ligase family protein [Patescibacteria group bacterium]|nr:O-antigen ligase family protein [Patescibacteria group bacterium]